MSEAHPSAHQGHGAARSEEDRVSTGRILQVGAASILLFILAGAAVVYDLHVRQAERGPLAVPAEVGRSKIGLAEQDFFDVAVRGSRENARKRDRLASYGWVDRNAGVVHIPIDRAMELVAQGVRPAPGAPGATTPGAQP